MRSTSDFALRLLPLAWIVGLAGAPATGLAQTPHRVDFYTEIAVGGSSMGFSGLVSGAVQSRHWVATLRTTGNLPPAGRPVATDLAVICSYAVRGRHTVVSVGTGVAMVATGDSSRTYGAPFNGHTTVGLPLQAEAFWRPAPGIGLGAIGVGDINSRRSFASLLFGIRLGRFD